MTIRRRTLLPGLGIMAVGGTARAQSDASAYPNRPIRVVVPFPPGVITDAAPRLVAEKLGAEWGVPLVVENRAGANGLIGTEAVVRAAPDGYTLGVALADTWSINPRLNTNLGYDPQRDLVGVAPLASVSFALVVSAGVPAPDLDGFLALARARPGGIRLGSWGEGSTGHLAMFMLGRAAGVELTHVAYRGAAAVYTDLAAGHIETAFAGVSTAVSMARDGRVRVLAVTGTERHPALPGVPAIVERYPDVVVRAWYALVAPARTPGGIVEKVNAAVGRAVRAPDVAARLTDGFLATPMVLSVPELAAFLREDAARWGAVIAAAGIRLE